MQFKISKTALLSQLPTRARVSLIGDWDLPDYFVFDGSPVQDIPDPLVKKHPEIVAALTALRWQLLAELLRHPEGVTPLQMGKHLRNRTDNSVASIRNNIAVHIKCIRKVLKDRQFPFEIRTQRGWGRYVLLPTHHE